MSILNLINFKSARYNPSYLKLLPVASRERPPQAKDFEDIQDIIINSVNKYASYNLNDYEVLSGLKVITITNNSITLSPSRILLNDYPVIIETDQVTINSNSSKFTIYIAIQITKEDNRYISSYKFNLQSGFPLINIDNNVYQYAYRNKNKEYIKQQLFEIYNNFVTWGLVYTNKCISPGEAYIKGTKIVFPYHTPIKTELTNYRLIIRDKSIIAINSSIKLDPNLELDLGLYNKGIWTPNKSIYQITNKNIKILNQNLDKLRDYLLETVLLKPIDTTSNLITDTFANTDNADISNLLFDCDIEQGSLILNRFSRITNDVNIKSDNTNTKIINDTPNVLIQNYISKPLISQLKQDSFITIGKSNRGILKLGPTKLETGIYQRNSDKTILLTQSRINAEVYGLTSNSSDFRLTIGNKLISTIINTDSNGKAKFSFVLPSGSNINEIITVQNNTSSATSSLYDTSYAMDTNYVGQVFNIDKDGITLVGGSIYIRKVNTTTPTIKVLLTRFTNKPQEILSQTIIENTQITTSVDGTKDTKFDFELPITLSKGTYSLIISSINNPIDLFITNSSVLNNSYLFSSDINQLGTTNYLNKDLKFELNTAIYSSNLVDAKLTITDNIDKFDYVYYPGKFFINNIEYTNEALINKTNSVDLQLKIDKYRLINPILISSDKNTSTYISKTIRTNFKYSNIYLEMDALILDSTSIRVYLSSNEGYSWEELISNSKYLVDGNDQTYKYIYNKDLNPITSIINREGKITDATRNYLTIRIDLKAESNNKPIVKGYKSYVR